MRTRGGLVQSEQAGKFQREVYLLGFMVTGALYYFILLFDFDLLTKQWVLLKTEPVTEEMMTTRDPRQI